MSNPCAGAPFAELYEIHRPFVRAVALRFLRDPAEADDVAQDVFMHAWTHLDTFDSARGEVRAWLGSMARSRALDRLRRRAVRSRAQLTPALVANGADALDGMDPSDVQAERLQHALKTLSGQSRDILELAYFEQMSQREIASAVGESLGVVKSRLKQGLAALRAGMHVRSTATCDPAAEPIPLTVTVARGAPASLPSLLDVRVMLVDDDARTRQVMHALMHSVGARSTICDSAAAALRQMEQVVPDVLVADLSMPGGDGLGLIRTVRALHSSLREMPALAFTGHAGELDRAAARLAGFDMHLSKPVHPLAVLTAVRQLADRRARHVA